MNLPNHLQMMAEADALVEIPEGQAHVEKGKTVIGQLLRRARYKEMFIGLLDGQIERISVSSHWIVNFANYHIIEPCGNCYHSNWPVTWLLHRVLL